MQSLTAHPTNLNSHENFFPNHIKTIYAKSEHTWSYLGKMIILTRHLLNAAGKSTHLTSLMGKDLPERVRDITTRLKLFSIVGVPFSLVSLKSLSEKIFNAFGMNDKESIALGSLSFAITATDVFDSITTFVNTTLSLSGRPPIECLSTLGLPLGFAMSGMGTISRIIQIAKVCQVSRSVKAVRKELLQAFLEQKLGVAEEQAKIAAPLTQETLKAIPGEIGIKLHRLYAFIALDKGEACIEQQFNQISQMLDDIQGLLIKKLVIEGLGVFANALIISALYLFCLGSLSSTPFMLLASSFFIRISTLLYQDL